MVDNKVLSLVRSKGIKVVYFVSIVMRVKWTEGSMLSPCTRLV